MIKVFSNGSYDVLTPAHRALLKYAKSLGNTLIVAIDSDRRVSERKGITRPIFNQKQRAEHLNDLRYVDCVFLFDSDQQLIDTISLVKPDILVIGEEYRKKEIIGISLVKEVVFFPYNPNISSTITINKTGLKKDDENEQWAYM